MSIKCSQKLVEEANEIIETLSPSEIKSLIEKNEITLIDVRDIRELWRDGTIENAKHMIRDCKLIAERNAIRFKFNSYFPIRSLNLMRGVLVAEEDNIKSYYIDSIFNTIWQDGLNMNDEVIIQKVLKNLHVNPKTFTLRSSSSLIKDSLRKKTSDAYERGIFGAPTFVVNNKIFWGQDRIEFALKEASK